ncbi:MAG: cation acetate symporter [Planctomycetes bacterium GWF2_41_51]|nr:MAG: cation acetate symporter [Planctomycetes bacterium GWF2_41_51]
MAFAIFAAFVAFVLFLSFYFSRQTQSASGFFAAGGQIHWAVNGVSFAGDYLSAASFLGICGMIAVAGYDGFLYSIGYLAGWIVALFVVAEPMKRLGKFTFTDALDSTFNSPGIQLAAGISTLIVSIFYLIPQMVGAGVLVTPLLGLPHAVGVIMVGTIVIIIVATAGMKSTTYVQFLKGALLLIFSTILVIAVCQRGLTTNPDHGGKKPYYDYRKIPAAQQNGTIKPAAPGFTFAAQQAHTTPQGELVVDFVKLEEADRFTWWKVERKDETIELVETASVTVRGDGSRFVNGIENSDELQVGSLSQIAGKSGDVKTGPVGAFKFLSLLSDKDTIVTRWKKAAVFSDGDHMVTLFASTETPGNKIMRPGLQFKVEGTILQRLDFVSLMLALFCGTAALPHILIRYYTVPSPACARKSTIVAIATIGFFYILTLYMGLGAMANGVVNPFSDNMSAPLLARSFNTYLFAIISAIAFATVLGTVSGLIIAASGAVAHDLLDRFYDLKLNERQKVIIGKAAAFTVGLIAIILGIVFQGMNVSYLVGWAFAVAASANLPAIIMLLFWKRTTASGIIASITVGIIVAVGLILLSPDMFERYGLTRSQAPFQLNQPGIISIPLSFITLIIVSLFTKKKNVKVAAI